VSYIRSGSNPEGLYIWGQADGTVHVAHNVPVPLSSKWPRGPGWKLVRGKIVPSKRLVDFPPCIVVPAAVFRDTCRQWAKDYSPTYDKTSRRGLVVEEMEIWTDTGLPVTEKLTSKDVFSKARRMRSVIRFSYKKQFFFMWRVTWMYIVRNNDFETKTRKKAKRKRASK
jgi:hypothetical protein